MTMSTERIKGVDVNGNFAEDEQNITRINLENREIILIGTAHVSKQSAELVKRMIEQERPDAVCIELDAERFESMKNRDKWKQMDIFKVIREKRSTLLLVNLIVSSFQRRMAKQFDIAVGQEMIQGIQSADDVGAELVLADRNIQTTFARIWHGLGIWGKAKLVLQIFSGIFADEEITEEELEKMKSEDMIHSMLQDLAEAFPQLKIPLIDERDQYLAQNIKSAPGKKIIAVLGAAHVPGIEKEIHQDHDLEKLDEHPPKSTWPKIIGWSIPVLIVALILFTFSVDVESGWQQTLSWILWNGSFAALGALIAFAHPLAILTAFVVAPISSLSPLMAAGWFAGLVQAMIHRPKVSDFEHLSEDVSTVKGFWHNKVTRVLLVVALANIGSTIGTFVGGFEVLRLFFDNF